MMMDLFNPPSPNESLLPQHLNTRIAKRAIGRDQSDAFETGLRGQHAIERILVSARQVAGQPGLRNGDWQRAQTRASQRAPSCHSARFGHPPPEDAGSLPHFSNGRRSG
jgi:hypothetical protein